MTGPVVVAWIAVTLSLIDGAVGCTTKREFGDAGAQGGVAGHMLADPTSGDAGQGGSGDSGVAGSSGQEGGYSGDGGTRGETMPDAPLRRKKP